MRPLLLILLFRALGTLHASSVETSSNDTSSLEALDLSVAGRSRDYADRSKEKEQMFQRAGSQKRKNTKAIRHFRHSLPSQMNEGFTEKTPRYTLGDAFQSGSHIGFTHDHRYAEHLFKADMNSQPDDGQIFHSDTSGLSLCGEHPAGFDSPDHAPSSSKAAPVDSLSHTSNSELACTSFSLENLLCRSDSRKSKQLRSAVQKSRHSGLVSKKKRCRKELSQCAFVLNRDLDTYQSQYTPTFTEEIPDPTHSSVPLVALDLSTRKNTPAVEGEERSISDSRESTTSPPNIVFRPVQQLRKSYALHAKKHIFQLQDAVVQALKNDYIMEAVVGRQFQKLLLNLWKVTSMVCNEALLLTPIERKFIRWTGTHWPDSKYITPSMMLEFVALYQVITGYKRVTLPLEVELLLSTKEKREDELLVLPSSNTKYPLFYEMMCTSKQRLQQVLYIYSHREKFLDELLDLSAHYNLVKAFDYSDFRTRFLIYAYTLASSEKKPSIGSRRLEAENILRDLAARDQLLYMVTDPTLRPQLAAALYRVTVRHGLD